MRIVDPILEPYCIEVEEDNFTLGIPKEYPQKNGTVLYQMHNSHYYQNFELLLKRVIKLKLAKDDSVVDLKTFLKKYKEVNEQVENRLKELLDA